MDKFLDVLALTVNYTCLLVGTLCVLGWVICGLFHVDLIMAWIALSVLVSGSAYIWSCVRIDARRLLYKKDEK